MWRMFQLEKSLSRDGHEYNKFGTGNWETLREEVVKRGKDPRQEMISWWEQNYAAERMKLVVLGKGAFFFTLCFCLPLNADSRSLVCRRPRHAH